MIRRRERFMGESGIREKFVNGFAKMDEFAYHAAANVGQFGTAEKQHCLDACEVAVDVSHIALVLKVGDVAHASEDELRPDAAGEVGGQPVVGGHADTRLAVEQPTDSVQALLEFRQRMLQLVHTHSDDNLIGKRQPSLDDIIMPHREGVKGSRKNSFHFKN